MKNKIQLTTTLDLEKINKLRTDRGGFTNATLIALGVGTKPKSGWIRTLIGKEIPDTQYIAALRGRKIFVIDRDRIEASNMKYFTS